MSKGSCLQTWTTIALFSWEKTKQHQSKQSYIPRPAAAAACSKLHVTAPSSLSARTLLNPRPLLFWALPGFNSWRLDALTKEAKARQLNYLHACWLMPGTARTPAESAYGWNPAPSREGHTWGSSFCILHTAREGSLSSSCRPASPIWIGKY